MNLIYGLFVVLAAGLLMAAPVGGQVPMEQSPPAGEPEPMVREAQSPINIDTLLVEEVPLPDLSFMYGARVNLEVVSTSLPGEPNDEKTVRANVPPGAGKLIIDGQTFNLLQFHWHNPGEHTLDGVGFPMEMHLVHQLEEAAEPADPVAPRPDLLVVGVWIEQGRRPHRELQKIFSRLPRAGGTRMVRGFNLTRLLPEDLGSFRYMGSLTTPEFNEGVQWIVMKEFLNLSPRQIGAFGRLFPGLNGNAREVQDLNGRPIQTEQPMVEVPVVVVDVGAEPIVGAEAMAGAEVTP